HRRNLPLLRKALKGDPGKVFSWCHLATIYASLGKDRRAEKAWKAGLAVVRKRPRSRSGEDTLPYLGLIQWRLARGRDTRRLLAEALERFPHNHQLHWLRGITLMRAGRPGEALPFFERLVACGRNGEIDRFRPDTVGAIAGRLRTPGLGAAVYHRCLRVLGAIIYGRPALADASVVDSVKALFDMAGIPPATVRLAVEVLKFSIGTPAAPPAVAVLEELLAE